MWTETTVKAELPDVQVKISSRIFQGHTSGRKNKYASVHVQGGKLRGINFPEQYYRVILVRYYEASDGINVSYKSDGYPDECAIDAMFAGKAFVRVYPWKDD